MGLPGHPLGLGCVCSPDWVFSQPATQCESEQLIARFCRAKGTAVCVCVFVCLCGVRALCIVYCVCVCVCARCGVAGIACVPVGPIVFYAGFTRAFLAGQTDTSSELLHKADQVRFLCVCMRSCVHVRVCARVCACACVCV